MPKPLILRRLPGKAEKLLDEKQLPPEHVVFNPSIAFPYIYIRGNKQTPNDESNYIILYNCETKQSSTIDNLENILQKNVNRYKGLEDLRLCMYKNKLWFVATTTHASDKMNSECVVGYFNNSKTAIERISVVPLGDPPVKNICPYIYDSKLCLFDIYKQKIYEVIDISDNKGIWQSFGVSLRSNITTGGGLDIENFRGSTSLVHLHGNLYGCVVHDVIFCENAEQKVQLAYMHHWIEIDLSLSQITFVSSPFWIVTFGLEFVSGIHKNGDIVELYFGLQDKLAFKYMTTLAFLRHGK
jgi:hypothetical protein